LSNLIRLLGRRILALPIMVFRGDVARVRRNVVLQCRPGKLVEMGPTDQIFHHPKDPYTATLLSAVPSLLKEHVS